MSGGLVRIQLGSPGGDADEGKTICHLQAARDAGLPVGESQSGGCGTPRTRSPPDFFGIETAFTGAGK